MERGLDRMALVILGHGGQLDGLALLVHVFIGLHADLEAAIGSDDRVVPGDFAAALIGNAGLYAVAVVAPVLVNSGVNGDLQSAIGIQLSGLLGELFSGVFVLAATFAIAPASSISFAAAHVVLLIAHEVRPIGFPMHNVLDLGSRHRLAKIIFCFDGSGGGGGLQDGGL